MFRLKKQIIAAVRNESELEAAIKTEVEIIFDLSPNIITLTDTVRAAHTCGKKLFIHIDLAEGIGKDKYGIAYAKSVGVDGIISTRTNMVKTSREEGLFTVQRFFIIDSHSVTTTLESVKSSKPDMIEIMPGVVAKVIDTLKKQTSVPVIAGGLIETKNEISTALRFGAAAVSTSNSDFWRI